MEIPPNGDLLTTLSNQMADAVERAGRSLVLVNGRQRHPASGVVIAPDTVLTADHVLEREENITVQTHDGRTLTAEFAGRDPSSDLAVLRVTDLGMEAAIRPVQEARVGQWTLAVGRPSEEGVMASAGIVSAVGGPLRSRRGAMLERYLQTDAIPYPGFSGGALIDSQGRVLGILTTGLVRGLALAVPFDAAVATAQTLAEKGRIRRGYLGITSQPVGIPAGQRAGRAQESGLLILHVEEESPSEQAGLLMGDILVGLDGQTVGSIDDLQPLLVGDRVGRSVPVDIIRGGVLQTVQVTLGEREERSARRRGRRGRRGDHEHRGS